MRNRWPVMALALNGACNMSTVMFIKSADDAGSDPTGDANSIDAVASQQPPAQELLSCAKLAATCGANGNDMCCNSPMVVGGMYYRSYDVANDVESGGISAPATVSSFRLDKYEVTVGRFRAFVNAGKGTHASPPEQGAGHHETIDGGGWDPTWSASLAADTPTLKTLLKCDATYQMWTDNPGDNTENRPMNCITWFEAMAFCAWDGGFLPTEAEWNYAAAGGDQQRAYPWSDPAGVLTPPYGYASYYCFGDGTPGCASTDLVAVGTKPAGDGRWGQSDLAANVWEWTLDAYTAYSTPCTNCINIADRWSRVIRGGSSVNIAERLRTSARSGVTELYTRPGATAGSDVHEMVRDYRRVMGVTVINVVTGAVLGELANGKRHDAYKLCADPATPCPDADQSNVLIHASHRRAPEANVAFGIAAAIGAGVLWFTCALIAKDRKRVGAVPTVATDRTGLAALGTF